MRRFALALACWLLCSVAAAQLKPLPDKGMLLGLVTSPEPGKWVVFAEGFLPVQPTVIDGGRTIHWQGPAGVYGIVFFPSGDGQPVISRLVLGEYTSPPPDLAVTGANVLAWVELVSLETRNERITHPVTDETLTRQQAVGQTFLNIGKAGGQIASVPGMDLLLSTALVSALGDSAAKWQPLADKLDAALQSLKDREVSADDYATAFITIGEALSGE